MRYLIILGGFVFLAGCSADAYDPSSLSSLPVEEPPAGYFDDVIGPGQEFDWNVGALPGADDLDAPVRPGPRD